MYQFYSKNSFYNFFFHNRWNRSILHTNKSMYATWAILKRGTLLTWRSTHQFFFFFARKLWSYVCISNSRKEVWYHGITLNWRLKCFEFNFMSEILCALLFPLSPVGEIWIRNILTSSKEQYRLHNSHLSSFGGCLI